MIFKGRKEVKSRFHVAVTIHGVRAWIKANDKTAEEAYQKVFSNIKEIIQAQIDNKVRILTFYLLPENREESDLFEMLIENIQDFLGWFSSSDFIHQNQVKVSVLGKWYNLPSRVIDPIKKVIDETKDYDNYFLNLCMNYNGQEEIVDACRLMLRKAVAEKIDVGSVDISMIKENIYTSAFLPPDLIIKNGLGKKLNGFMLWDSVEADIVFTSKLFPDFGKDEFVNEIK